MGKIHQNSFKSLLSLILTLSLLTSCQKTPQEELSCDIDSIQALVSGENTVNKLDVSLNIDGSDSMLGYVTIPNNNYAKALELLANAVINTNNVNVAYKRIGDDKTITRDNLRRDATSRTFYDGNDSTYEAVSSPIQTAITPPVEGKDKLTIIVTDLEGDDGGKIAEVLAQNYLNKDEKNQDYTVGIWAVKSQFNGIIYDPNTGKAKFSYTTEGKSSEGFRPFYVLFIGKYDQIATYFDELKKLDTEIHKDSKMLIFPTKKILLQNPISLGNLEGRKSNSKLPENNQLQRIFALDDGNVIVSTQDANNEPYELFDIVDNTESKLAINYQVPFPDITKIKGGNYALSIEDTNLITNTKVYTFNPNYQDNQVLESTAEESETKPEENEEEKPETIENQQVNQAQKEFFSLNSSGSLKQALTVKDLKLDQENQTLAFLTDININNLPNPEIYLFEVDLILDDFSGQDWWTEWSSIGQNNDGSKTQNLSIFMNKLKSLNLKTLSNDENDPVIGRFCFGLQKNY
ncbi:hypothetical protein [Geminocystis herdmanii]|uniref:hypothetical protein n=1 Tax=Geminocystis herdmanii TaxID=669359 RepID=UPI000347F066|nr:hypothetical protein [Geminocystis herdmanii]